MNARSRFQNGDLPAVEGVDGAGTGNEEARGSWYRSQFKELENLGKGGFGTVVKVNSHQKARLSSYCRGAYGWMFLTWNRCELDDSSAAVPLLLHFHVHSVTSCAPLMSSAVPWALNRSQLCRLS